MSVSAAIITDMKQDVLFVPNSAVKQQGGEAYVEVMVNNTPERRTVTTGLTNDTATEIVSGLAEKEQVVTQTTTTSSTSTNTSGSTSAFRIPGIGGGPGRD
jgi:HlyD family secretion protein